jgi:hypothetical protein
MRTFPRPATLALCLLFAAVVVAGAQSPAAGKPPDLTVLMRHVIERTKWEKDAKLDLRYSWQQDRVVEKYDQSGNIQDRTELRFDVMPAGDTTSYHMLAKNGRALSGDEQKKEEDKEAKSSASLKNTKKSAQDQSVTLDEELLSRFNLAYLGEEAVGGRKAYVLSVAPRPGPLPEKRRLDRVLNRLRGKVWIDEGTYALSKVDMALTEPVSFLIGLGAVRSLHFVVEMRAVEPGVLVPHETWVEYDSRVFFSNSRVHQHSVYSDYRPVPAVAGLDLHPRNGPR